MAETTSTGDTGQGAITDVTALILNTGGNLPTTNNPGATMRDAIIQTGEDPQPLHPQIEVTRQNDDNVTSYISRVLVSDM